MKSKISSLILVIFGIILLIYTWQPVISWHFFAKPKFLSKPALLSPLAQFHSTERYLSQEKSTNFYNFAEQENSETYANHFFLTIEKFQITRAKVATGDNFSTQLAHLPESARPGLVGNVFISGHSALPQFFSPKNYWSIFSKLYLMEVGDKIILEANGQTFTYIVTEMLVVGPRDLWVISPPRPYGSYLTLLTCGVGGFTQDRIIVRAELSGFHKLT